MAAPARGLFRWGIAPRDGRNAARSVASAQINAEKLVTL
ncbi:hypothetical protein BLA15945_04393 [Burkholderia lata]|uniref:Uncharacterized protein n=2 Tax=Burkholderia lata (strain ATCC 17760 / DSM 23089 / LMG 22485 / NCIMB 9086 / R18194 / 383) TaxID=482957 RepID=A0A6P2NAZ7_BURL3|nr:hypothetical protein BLA15945_04393 [Burkholderia lata]